MAVSEGYKKMELKELQAKILQTMKFIHSFCVDNGVEYYIIAGTVLGSIRHKGFIPWDDDIDIAMTRPNFDKFRESFLRREPPCQFFLQDYLTDKDFGLALMRVCIPNTYQDWPAQNHLRNRKNAYIDIFPLDNAPNDETLRKRQARSMKRLNALCSIKLYKVTKSRNSRRWIIKSILHLLLVLIPTRWLVNRKLAVMKRYNNDDSCQCLCSMQSHYSYSKQTISRTIYGKPSLLPFEDTFFYGPEKAKDYLSHLYGNYMIIPPVEKRPQPLDTYIKQE